MEEWAVYNEPPHRRIMGGVTPWKTRRTEPSSMGINKHRKSAEQNLMGYKEINRFFWQNIAPNRWLYIQKAVAKLYTYNFTTAFCSCFQFKFFFCISFLAVNARISSKYQSSHSSKYICSFLFLNIRNGFLPELS